MRKKNPEKYRWIRLCIVLSLLNIPVVLCSQSFLSKKVTVNIDSTVYYTLNVIGDSIGFYFSYNASLIADNEKVKIKVERETVEDILKKVFPDKEYYYRAIGNQIAISKDYEIPVEYKSVQVDTFNMVSLNGSVVDKETGKGVPYATVGIPDKSKWVVCNYNGAFVMNLLNPETKDTLTVSSLGYKGYKLSLAGFIDQKKTIQLERDIVPIQEVVIRMVDPLGLIEKALQKISDNYFNRDYRFNGFYRETIRKNTKYIGVSEAVVKGYKSSYLNTHASDQMKIVKSRKILNDQNQDTLIMKLQAGMYTSLLLDVIKNQADFLNPEFFEDYRYQISDIILSDNKYVYVIEFNRKESSPYAMYKGKIYIDYATSAIINVEFSLNRYGVSHASEFMIVKKPIGLRIGVGGASYRINYTLSNDSLYHVNYIRSENIFKIKKNRKFFASQYKIISEVAITGIEDKNAKRYPRYEVEGKRDVFSEKVTTYDEDYWKDYSYIPPEKPLLEAINEFE